MLYVMPFDPAQVYQPEADTYLLLAAARNEMRPGDRVLEIGTGSGTIAAGLAAAGCIVATEINPHAAQQALRQGVAVIRTDLAAGVRGTFDLILFNPPYLPTKPEERIDDWLEYALDGGPDGRAVIERFAQGLAGILAPGGRVLLLVSELTGREETVALFARHGFSATTLAEEPAEGEMLYVLKIVRA